MFCLGGFCPGGFWQGGFLSRGFLSGGLCPGGFCPRTILWDESDKVHTEFDPLAVQRVAFLLLTHMAQ